MPRKALNVIFLAGALAIAAAAIFCFASRDEDFEFDRNGTASSAGRESAARREGGGGASGDVLEESERPASIERATAESGQYGFATLIGRVRHELNGAFLAGIGLQVEVGGVKTGESTTGRDGCFEISRLGTEKAVTLQVKHARFAALPIAVAALAAKECRDLGEIFVAPKTPLRGTVIDDRGRGLPGATVELLQYAPITLVERVTASKRNPLLATTTDEHGVFAFESLPAGAYFVAASSEGRERTTSSPILLKEGLVPRPVQIRLGKGVTLAGRAVDKDGRGIDGAHVVAVRVWTDDADILLGVHSRTDAAGQFVLKGMKPGSLEVEVRAQGFSQSNIEYDMPAKGELVVTLDRGTRLTGRIFDKSTGAALANVQVIVTWPIWNGRTGFAECCSDLEGLYLAEGVATKDDLRVFCRLPGWAIDRGDSRDFNEMTAGGITIAREELASAQIIRDLAMVRGGSITGRVIADENGQPIAGASVAIMYTGRFSIGDMRTRIIMTGTDGSYRIDDVAPGPFVITATHPEWVMATPLTDAIYREFDDEKARCNLISGGEVAGHDIRMTKGISASGVVVDVRGNPLAGADVAAISSRRDFMFSEQSRVGNAITDAEGRFRLIGLEKGTSVWMAARHADHPFGAAQAMVVDGEISRMRLIARQGGRIEGTVIGVDGSPAVGLELGILRVDRVDRQARVFDPDDFFDERRLLSRTDGEGRFAFENVEPALMQVTVDWKVASDFLHPGRQGSADLRSERFVQLRIQLERPVTIRGVVVDEAGNPVPWIAISAELDRPDILAAEAESDLSHPIDGVESGIDGAFALAGLEKGRKYNLDADDWRRLGGGGTVQSYEIASPVTAVGGTTGVRIVLKAKTKAKD